MVRPLSLLAARDAAPVREAVRARGALTDFWTSATPAFAGTAVLTCVPVVRVGGSGAGVALPDDEWGELAAPALGIPAVAPRTDGVLGDLGPCTADFRDQYYGLAPYVHEAATVPDRAVAPLVTSGLIDPARSWWGERGTRFLKRRWDAPVIDLDALRDEPKLHRWATRRLVPKVLVGTQGKVIEAVVDEDGRWLPSVPTITVVPDPALLWHVLAVLLAPPVSAVAAAEFAGTALSMRAIKLSAAQVGQLPLPADRGRWDDAARAVRQAQLLPFRRPELLVEAGAHMCAAYRVGTEPLDWWRDRL
jgi:hypothetical protein